MMHLATQTAFVAAASEAHGPLTLIRRATHDIHERLHAQPLFRQLLQQTITRDDYASLLAILYGFHQPLEAALVSHAGWQHSDLRMHERCRAHLLREDLSELGWISVADLPLAEPPADLGAPGRLLGCLYVREGSMLGGRVLARKLDYLLGTCSAGRLFFSGRDNDPALWRACCTAIEGNNDKAEVNAMVLAAQETFESFERWITRASTLTNSASTLTKRA